MVELRRRAALGLLLGLVAAAPASGGAPSGTDELSDGFRDGGSAAEPDRILAASCGRVRKRWTRIDGVLAAVPRARIDAAIRALEREPSVEYAEPNHVLRVSTSDPRFGELWGLAKIEALSAWQVTI